jgi:hypothetical protein
MDEFAMNERFGIGKVIGTGFGVWIKNIIPFLLLTTLVFAPLFAYLLGVVNGYIKPSSLSWFVVYFTAGAWILQLLASAVITYGVVMQLQGQRASIVKCVGVGLARFFPALAVGLIVGICEVAGLVALLVPGIIIACMWYVAMPASVVEKPGIGGALGRSARLTENHRLEIFGILVLLFLLQKGLEKVVEGTWGPGHGANLNHYFYALFAMMVFMASITATFQAVAYYYLRQEKEGTSAAELAKVFE